jgi:tripartite-type tricarboxylate transporter receptor subunit TctC
MQKQKTSRVSIVVRAGLALVALAGAVGSPAATAQTFPNGQLRIISPYPPGGGTDVLGRMIAQRYTERFNQPAIVENRVGANGTIGTAFVAKAPPDGLTLLIVPAGYAANPSLYKSLPYEQSRDLAPVSLLASGPLVLVVYPSLPVRSVKELIALAKARPGDLNFGSPGSGALPHLSAELFNAMAGTKMTHVPYKGPAAAVADLMSGQIALYFMNVTQAIPLVEAKKLRALGVTSPKRSATAPQILTIAEQELPGFDMTNWYGMLVPAATPKGTINAIYTEVKNILNLPETTKSLAGMGMVVEATTPDQFAAFIKRESAKYLRVIQAAGITGTL